MLPNTLFSPLVDLQPVLGKGSLEIWVFTLTDLYEIEAHEF